MKLVIIARALIFSYLLRVGSGKQRNTFTARSAFISAVRNTNVACNSRKTIPATAINTFQNKESFPTILSSSEKDDQESTVKKEKVFKSVSDHENYILPTLTAVVFLMGWGALPLPPMVMGLPSVDFDPNKFSNGVPPQTLGIALGTLPVLAISGAGLSVWGRVQKRKKEIDRKESVRVAAEFARANPPPLNLANFEAFISDLPIAAKAAVSLRKGSMADGDTYLLSG